MGPPKSSSCGLRKKERGRADRLQCKHQEKNGEKREVTLRGKNGAKNIGALKESKNTKGDFVPSPKKISNNEKKKETWRKGKVFYLDGGRG